MTKSYVRSKPKAPAAWGGGRTKAITIRVSEQQLRRLMRLRGVATQSQLIHTLLDEDEERFASEQALREATGVAKPGDFDDRLL